MESNIGGKELIVSIVIIVVAILAYGEKLSSELAFLLLAGVLSAYGAKVAIDKYSG